MTDTTASQNIASPADAQKNSQEKNTEKENGEKLQTENKELLDTLKRVQADFENFQKRSAKEKESAVQLGKALAFRELLEFLDSFDSAVSHVKDEHRKGMENLRTQLLKILERNGIHSIFSVGKKFNPELHECLMQGNDPMQGDDIILEEFQKGYTINGSVLRTAKVKVNTQTHEKPSSDEKKGEKNE